MKTILKASVICWMIVLAFLIFFMLPVESLSLPIAAVISVVAGGVFLAGGAFYVHRLRKTDGFEFGWFLAQKHGLRLSVLGGIAVVLLLAGGIFFLSPATIEQPLVNGAMPAAMVLVVLFWVSLIFIFLGWALVCFAESAGYLRIGEYRSSAGAFGLALLWLALGTGCCSLFLDVINDVFHPLTISARRWTYTVTALFILAAGIGFGLFRKIADVLPAEDVNGKAD